MVKYLPVDNRFLSDIKETIRYMDQRANQVQQPMEKENRGAFANPKFFIEWIQHDGTQNMLAKVDCTGCADAPLNDRFQSLTEAVCSLATYVWHDQYGRETKVSHIENIECGCDLGKDTEFFILFERLAASHKEYRGDVTLLNREGCILGRWQEVRGDRFIN